MADEWVIEPRGRNLRARLSEVWTFRRLFGYFAKRAVERLYKSTALGPAWLFIRPLFPLAINALVFPAMGVYGWWRCSQARARLKRFSALRDQLRAP